MFTCVWLFHVGDTVAFTQAGLHSFWPWSLIRILSFWWCCLTGVGIWSDWLQMGFRLSLPSCLFPVALETRHVHGFSLCVTGNRPGYLRISCKTGWVRDQFPQASPGHRAPHDLFLHTLYGRFMLTRTVVVQLLSCVQLFVTPWTAARQASLSFTISWSPPKLVHRVGDAIQPSHPLSSPSPHTFNLSQHQGLFQWVGSLHQVAKILEIQLQHQSFQWMFRVDLL